MKWECAAGPARPPLIGDRGTNPPRRRFTPHESQRAGRFTAANAIPTMPNHHRPAPRRQGSPTPSVAVMPAFFDYTCLVGPHVALALAAIYTTAAVFSGLSGFGFSAIGCLSLTVLPPQLGVAVLMGLSLLTQATSFGSLWQEMRRHAGPWHRRDGVLPYLVGGTVGMPLGLQILAGFDPRELSIGLGLLLIAYAAWSLRKPAALRVPAREPRMQHAFLVGAAGGIVGGFSAFPGSAMVVWNSLLSRGKQQGRALTQPYILWMQTIGLALLATLRPELFSHTFWMIFLAAAPAALLGNLLGVAIYRRTGDKGYRRVTLLALGIAGVGLLLKVALAGPAA